MKKIIGIIGGGNMGAAIYEGISDKRSVFICENDTKRRNLLKRKYKTKLLNLKDIIKKSTVIIVAVKPQNFENLLKEVQKDITTKKLVISIAAGITSKYIEKRLCKGVRVVRTMPNLPAQVKQGITAISKGKYAKNNDLKIACAIFNNIGQTVIVNENLIDSITAVSGSGPAYVFLFIECMIKAATNLGLNPSLSNKLVLQTLKGSFELIERQKEDARNLRMKVTSKGGTTQAAMDVFFKNNFDKTFINALKSAKKKAKELSK